jgi:pimeloyl-ACP methyl ester carboxylesterase
VVSFDAPGHGESGPGALGRGRSTLPELAEAVAAVTAVGGPADGIVAHSLGASATTLAVLDGLAADRLVLVAPIAAPIAYTREFAAAMGFGPRVHTGLLRRIERLVDRPLADFDLPARLAAAEPPPALVVHDRQDKESRYADGEALVAAWPGAELAGTDGLGHRRILRDPEVVRRAVTFLTAACGQLSDQASLAS